MSSSSPIIAISGVTLTGNMGGVAMLRTAVANMQRRFPSARFRLLSVSPDRDRKARQLDNVEVVPCAAPRLLLIYLPLAILAWPFVRFPAVRRILCKIAYFRALHEADLVVDLCGIAFVDGRGLALLAYNVACCLPAIVFGTPIAKLSQALGPFRSLPNRMAAKIVLERCKVVVARGKRSFEFLRELGLTNTYVLPDVTFAMEIQEAELAAAQSLLRQNGVATGRPVIFSPSEVVNRLCSRAGIDFESECTAFLKTLTGKGHQVLLLPHSLARDRSKNNDVALCRRIADRVGHPVKLIEVEDPGILRAIIAEAEIFIGCRFHSVVGALAKGVPALIIGWSHKYEEMAEALGAGRYAMDWRSFNAQSALCAFEALYADRASVRKAIGERLPQVRADAERNFDLAASLIQ